MMHHAHRRRGSGAAGPIFGSAWKPGVITGHRHLGSSGAADLISDVSCHVRFVVLAHAAGRKLTPASISPAVTKRQIAMSNLRAKATIMVLRVLGASWVRVRYHCANSLFF
jgi:hypothetical protein